MQVTTMKEKLRVADAEFLKNSSTEKQKVNPSFAQTETRYAYFNHLISKRKQKQPAI
jgi:hypothetical protein